jgi:hypothetical protein
MIECDIFSIDENLNLIVTTYSYDKVIDEDEYDQTQLHLIELGKNLMIIVTGMNMLKKV